MLEYCSDITVFVNLLNTFTYTEGTEGMKNMVENALAPQPLAFLFFTLESLFYAIHSTPMLSLLAVALFRLRNILSKLYLSKVSLEIE